jgi:hypothetical protein
MTYETIEGYWNDAGTFHALLDASNWAADKHKSKSVD